MRSMGGKERMEGVKERERGGTTERAGVHKKVNITRILFLHCICFEMSGRNICQSLMFTGFEGEVAKKNH